MRWITGAGARAALLVLAVHIVGESAIKTGKSAFWADLEAGKTRRFTPMGTSVSQTKNSYWPGELTNQLRERFGDAFVIEGAYTARQGYTSDAGIESTLPTVIDKQPHAVTIEYSIMDSHPERGISLEKSRANLITIIESLRASCPGVEIFLWEAAYPRDPDYQARPNLDEYYHLMEDVASEKETYLVNTYDRFKGIYDSLAAMGREDEYITWIRDTHHPSLYAATTLIVPAMIGVFSGDPEMGQGTPLSVSSLAGRVFYVGDELTIEWVRDPEQIAGVSVALSLDAGRIFTTLSSSPQTTSPFVWPIPEQLNGASTITDSALVRVLDTGGMYRGNTGFFGIRPASGKPALAVIPLAGRTFTVGDTLEVQWSYDANKVTAFDVEISFDGGRTFQPISGSSVESDHYDWPIPATLNGTSTPTLEAVVKVTDYNKQYEDNSGTFAIRMLSPAELIIDNSDPAVTFVGEWPISTGLSGYQGDNYQHDNNTTKGGKSVAFTGTVPEAGRYELFMRWVAHENRASNVPIEIHHRGGTSPVMVDQRSNGSRWNLLGTFDFDGPVRVVVKNDWTDGFVIADAVRLLQVSPLRAHGGARTQRSTGSLNYAVDERGIRLRLPEGGRYRIELFDVGGRRILSRHPGQPAGSMLHFPAPPGMSVIRLTAGGRTRTVRVVAPGR